MADVQTLAARVRERLGERVTISDHVTDMVTAEVRPEHLLEVCRVLRDEAAFGFEQLTDLCGVDYLAYGQAEWATESVSGTGFSRGVAAQPAPGQREGSRFAVVYHLISYRNNHRLRLRVFAAGEPPLVESVVEIWAAANWFEREAFDLYGILFNGHPDLRRILTDYGFIGHPFRKDFPLSGNVEMRYDPEQARVVYEPVDIEPRVLVPRVIRHDHRYRQEPAKPEGSDA